MRPLTLRSFACATAAFLGFSCGALAWQEPPRGSELRSDILAAIRPVAALDLNPPLEFVVLDLRHDGDLAFGALDPQRPGGAPIAWDTTKLSARGEEEDWFDGTTIHAFFERVNNHWYVRDFSIGATDVWWYQSPLCDTYKRLIPEVC